MFSSRLLPTECSLASRLPARQLCARTSAAAGAATPPAHVAQPAKAPQSSNNGASSLESQPCERPDSNGTVPKRAVHRASRQNTTPSSCSLRSVPGVGPKNERILTERGFPSVDALRQHFCKQAGGDTAAMMAYLQGDVGIRMRNHCKQIAEHLESLEGNKQGPELVLPLEPKLTMCVEGNISAGKSTFLKMLRNELVELQEVVEMVPEPVAQWQNVDGTGKFNMLEAFYENPERYAYTFQNYVFITRVMQEQGSAKGNQRLIERSVFSDRMVFVRAVHNAKWMSDLELNVYDSWFDPIVSALPTIIPDAFVYLRASPQTCHNRMKRRSRNEEASVSLDYLSQLHEMHEQWLRHPEGAYNRQEELIRKELGDFQRNDSDLSRSMQIKRDMASQEQLFLGLPEQPAEIKDNVWFLDRKHQEFMHPSAEGIPALVLDYDQDIDLERDQEAKRSYAKQVSQYFKWVQELRRRKDAYRADWEQSGPLGHMQNAVMNQRWAQQGLHRMGGDDSSALLSNPAVLQQMMQLSKGQSLRQFAAA